MQTPSVAPSPASKSVTNKLPTSYNPNAKGVMGEIWKHHKRHAEIEELDLSLIHISEPTRPY